MERCSACQGCWHPSLGSQLGAQGTIRLCWGCTLEFISWVKRREGQMGRAWHRHGVSEKGSWTEAALSSIKPKKG